MKSDRRWPSRVLIGVSCHLPQRFADPPPAAFPRLLWRHLYSAVFQTAVCEADRRESRWEGLHRDIPPTRDDSDDRDGLPALSVLAFLSHSRMIVPQETHT